MIKCKKNINPFNWKTALAFSFIISFTLNALFAFVGIEGAQIANIDISNVLMKAVQRLISNTVMLFLLYMFAFKVIQMPVKTHAKTIVTIVSILLATVVLSVLFSVAIISVRQIEFNRLFIAFRMAGDIFVAIIVLLSTSQLYIRHLRQQTLIENERLIAENIRNRYEALKSQIDPHFLFNSLNTLNGLIGFDNNRAHKYVEKLSSVFRYTIQNKEITTLQEELDFTNSYSYLMKIRYGENLKIEHRVSEKYLSYRIMPISIQLLIENALKHNVISNKYPLTVRIFTTETDMLVVENNVQIKEFASPSSGIGLANLCERYKLLFHKEIAIINANNIFRVEIPLIETKAPPNLPTPFPFGTFPKRERKRKKFFGEAYF